MLKLEPGLLFKVTRKPYLFLILVLGIAGTVYGIAFAPSPMTITLAGDVVATDNMQVDGTISSQTIDSIDSRLIVLEGGG